MLSNILCLAVATWLVAMWSLESITKKIYGNSFIAITKNEYYKEYDWLFSKWFLDVFAYIHFYAVMVMAPIVVLWLHIQIIKLKK